MAMDQYLWYHTIFRGLFTSMLTHGYDLMWTKKGYLTWVLTQINHGSPCQAKLWSYELDVPWRLCWLYPLVPFNIAMESGPFIADFPSYKPPFMLGIFPWLCYIYPMVNVTQVGGLEHKIYQQFPWSIWDRACKIIPTDLKIFQRGRLNHQAVTAMVGLRHTKMLRYVETQIRFDSMFLCCDDSHRR